MRFEHVDGATTTKLVNVQEVNSKGSFEHTQVQWNPNSLKQEISNMFVSVPFFSVSNEEYLVAGKAIDDFIYAEYDQATCDRFEDNNDLPQTLEQDILKKYSMTYKPYLLTMQKKLQNKYCKYQKLKRELPDYPGLRVFLWSGHEVKGPFEVNRKKYYNMVILRGRRNQIDAFIKNYGL